MVKQFYRMIMDDDENPFNKLPKTTRFQLMTTLAYMWCALFSAGIGSYTFFGTSVILHTLVLVGIFFTAYFFYKAENNQIKNREVYIDQKDGGVKYDDIWGVR
jgi:hypothetical protein